MRGRFRLFKEAGAHPVRRATIARTSARSAGARSTERWIDRPSIIASRARAVSGEKLLLQAARLLPIQPCITLRKAGARAA